MNENHDKRPGIEIMTRNQRWISLAAMTLVFAAGCSPSIGPIGLGGISLDIPFAVPGGPYVGVAGQPVPFDGSGSSDPEGHALTYDWSFGDGSTSTLPMPTHTYLAAGSYTVTLRVCDNSQGQRHRACHRCRHKSSHREG